MHPGHWRAARGLALEQLGADIAADDSFLLVADESPGLTEGAFRKLDLHTGEVASIKYKLEFQEIGGGDVAIAANALHATRNIRRTLRNVKEVLKGGGLLALNELSRNGLSVHLTFGLLDGWWL